MDDENNISAIIKDKAENYNEESFNHSFNQILDKLDHQNLTLTEIEEETSQCGENTSKIASPTQDYHNMHE